MSSATPSATPAFTRDGPGIRYRVESIPIRRLGNFGLALSLVVAAGVLRWINLAHSPAGTTDEGLLVQRAWLLHRSASFDDLTTWYDHPPLGWLFLSLWSSATSAFDNASSAIGAGRSLALVASVVTSGLLWVLARRVGLHRWTTALALVLVAVSPLALEMQRQISFEGLAVPWLVAAFVLAEDPRRPLLAFAGSAVCLAVAVLTDGASLVFAPVLVWQLRQSGLPSTRRYGFVVGGALFGAACLGYVIDAMVRGSLTAGADHAGQLDGLRAQLFDRTPTGNVLTEGSYAWDSIATWLTLDAIVLAAVVAAAVGVLDELAELRPYAVCALLPIGLALVPGFASTTLIVLALPFGAVVVAGAIQDIWDRARFRPVVGLLAAAGVAVAAGTLWASTYDRLLTADDDAPALAAETWAAENLPRSHRVIVDDALWTDLAQSLGPGRLTGYMTLEGDPAVVGPDAAAMNGDWRSYDVIVSTEALRSWPERFPGAAAALRESILVATFGTGADRIELRRVKVGETADTAEPDIHDATVAVHAGVALAQNPGLTLTASARGDLVAGEVDMRLMTTLVAMASLGDVQVDAFPADPAERSNPDSPRRSVELQARSADAVDAIADLLQAQAPPYRPALVQPRSGDRLTVTYTPATLL